MMKKTIRLVVLSALTLCSVAAFAQNLYESVKAVSDQGLSLRSWGGGLVSETDEMSYEGRGSIRISSRNFFQGGIINFAKPVNLATARADKDNLLLFTIHSGATGTATAGPGVGAPGRGAPGGIPGLAGGQAGGPVGGPEDGGKDGGRGAGGVGAATMAPSTMQRMRVVVATTDGKRSEAYIDVRNLRGDSRGWYKTGVPLAAINGFDKTNGEISSIWLASDVSTTFYIGNVRVLQDATPIFADVSGREYNLALGDEITFNGTASGGATALKFEWDFNSGANFNPVAEGATVKHRFRTPGTFTVVLRVSDVYGLKQPYSVRIKVTVNP